jgi:hypothetical protein
MLQFFFWMNQYFSNQTQPRIISPVNTGNTPYKLGTNQKLNKSLQLKQTQQQEKAQEQELTTQANKPAKESSKNPTIQTPNSL